MEEIRYSIRDLENFTQIKAHTIRIWEQRYGLLAPKRTETNIRYYSESDLKKILNINLLYNSGLKISKIAALSENEIIESSKDLILTPDSDKQSDFDELILNILNFKGDQILNSLRSWSETMKIEELYESFIIPALEKIGQLWQVNSIEVIHEHYFSNLFREFLLSKIQAINVKGNPKKNAVLFLHDNEEHEFGILIYYYILKSEGYTCHYFGQKTPLKDLDGIMGKINPKVIATTFTAKIDEKKYKLIERQLQLLSVNSHIIISGNQLNFFNLELTGSMKRVNGISELKALI